MTVPYTYLLKCIPENCFYYGVRFANGCHPDDFWNVYFTSSKIVKNKINLYGKEAFIFEIRKIFDTKEEAILWETRVLTKLKVSKKQNFYNKTNNKSIPPLYGNDNPATSDEVKSKISKTLKKTAARGENHPRKLNPEKYSHIGDMLKGRKNHWSAGDKNCMHRPEIKEKFRKMRGSHGNNGRVQTEEEKEKRRISNLGKSRQKYDCSHCGINVAKNVLLRWHNDNCKLIKDKLK
jgi:hypothetical protein